VVSGKYDALLVAVLLFLAGCKESRVYEKNLPVEGSGWNYGTVKSFDVHILDTAALYDMYINVRHTDAYPYQNVWLTMTTVFPDSSKQENKINIQLAEPGGKWTGDCVDGICFNTVLVQNGFHLGQSGTYTFMLEQDMRINPLPDIMDIGIKLEKETAR